MSSDSFDHKILLVVRTQGEAKEINMILAAAGMADCEIETAEGNLVNKLQDRSYVGCIVSYNAMTSLTSRIIRNIRSNLITSQLPIICLAPGAPWDLVRDLYDAGVNFVAKDNIVAQKEEIAWMMDSLIRYANVFKAGREKFFR